MDHRGAFYRLRDMPGSPVPVQARIPLLLGGGGPRMLRFAACNADIVGLVPRSLRTGGLDPDGFGSEATDEKVRWLDDAAGGEPGPQRSALIFAVTETTDEAAVALGIDPAAVAGSPHVLVGDTAQMVDALVEARQRWGLSYFVFFERDTDKLIPIRALATP